MLADMCLNLATILPAKCVSLFCAIFFLSSFLPVFIVVGFFCFVLVFCLFSVCVIKNLTLEFCFLPYGKDSQMNLSDTSDRFCLCNKESDFRILFLALRQGL